MVIIRTELFSQSLYLANLLFDLKRGRAWVASALWLIELSSDQL